MAGTNPFGDENITTPEATTPEATIPKYTFGFGKKGWGNKVYDVVNTPGSFIGKPYDKLTKEGALSFDKTSSGRPTILSLNIFRLAARVVVSPVVFALKTASSAVASVAYGAYHAIAAPIHLAGTALSLTKALINAVQIPFAKDRAAQKEIALNDLKEAGRHFVEAGISTAIAATTVVAVTATLGSAGVAPVVGAAVIGVGAPIVGPMLGNVIAPLTKIASLSSQGTALAGQAAPGLGKGLGKGLEIAGKETGKLLGQTVANIDKLSQGTIVEANKAVLAGKVSGTAQATVIGVESAAVAGVVGVKTKEAVTKREFISGKEFKSFKGKSAVTTSNTVAPPTNSPNQPVVNSGGRSTT